MCLKLYKRGVVNLRISFIKIIALQILMVTLSWNVFGVKAAVGNGLSLTADELLNEAVQLAQSTSDFEQAQMLTRIATAYAKIGSVKIATSLLEQAARAIGPFNDAESSRQIQVLNEIISVERQIGNRKVLEKTVMTALSFLAKHTAAQDAKNPVEKDFVRLEELLGAAGTHAAAGNTDEAKASLRNVVRVLRQLGWEQQGLLRQLLARRQAQVGDDEAAHATLSENEAFFKKFSTTYNQPLLPYFREVSSITLVAKEQYLAGHQQAAQESLKKAYAKAKAIPTRVGDQSDDGPRSAALRSVVMIAAEIGMTTLAVEAQHGITDTAYQGALSLVIRALARNGDSSLAHKLAVENKCCNELLALGLAEHEDWESSVKADEAQGGGVGGWERNDSYFKEVAKARFLVRGITEALAWARQKPKTVSEKILALLGVAEGVAARKAAR